MNHHYSTRRVLAMLMLAVLTLASAGAASSRSNA